MDQPAQEQPTRRAGEGNHGRVGAAEGTGLAEEAPLERAGLEQAQGADGLCERVRGK
jgi:hypothetical protein